MTTKELKSYLTDLEHHVRSNLDNHERGLELYARFPRANRQWLRGMRKGFSSMRSKLTDPNFNVWGRVIGWTKGELEQQAEHPAALIIGAGGAPDDDPKTLAASLGYPDELLSGLEQIGDLEAELTRLAQQAKTAETDAERKEVSDSMHQIAQTLEETLEAKDHFDQHGELPAAAAADLQLEELKAKRDNASKARRKAEVEKEKHLDAGTLTEEKETRTNARIDKWTKEHKRLSNAIAVLEVSAKEK